MMIFYDTFLSLLEQFVKYALPSFVTPSWTVHVHVMLCTGFFFCGISTNHSAFLLRFTASVAGGFSVDL